MRLSNRIVLATLNRDKFGEFKSLLSVYPELELAPAWEMLRNANMLGFVESHETYLENAVAKARFTNRGCHYPALADDSGLEVSALGGKPGVRSHRYAPPKSGMTQDEANTELLFKELAGKPREAKFVCVVAMAMEGILFHATGVLEGSITEKPRGTNGFGYDPVFLPKDSSKTLAEMTDMEKNAISHRAKALQELMNQLKSHGVVFAKP